LDDELFRRFASSFERKIAAAIVRGGHQSNQWFRRWVTHVQDRAERHYRRQRIDTMQRDSQWVRALGFVGKTRK